jgi:hypothetical protein
MCYNTTKKQIKEFGLTAAEFLKIRHWGKLNLVPRYGFPLIEKTEAYKKTNSELFFKNADRVIRQKTSCFGIFEFRLELFLCK